MPHCHFWVSGHSPVVLGAEKRNDEHVVDSSILLVHRQLLTRFCIENYSDRARNTVAPRLGLNPLLVCSKINIAVLNVATSSSVFDFSIFSPFLTYHSGDQVV
jgi:hypothetical protein